MSSSSPYGEPQHGASTPSAPQAGYGGPPQPGQYAGQYAGYPPVPSTDTMAILGLVFAFVFWPLGIIFSAIGLRHTKSRAVPGHGLALAGLIVGIVVGLLVIAYVAFFIVLLAHAGTAGFHDTHNTFHN